MGGWKDGGLARSSFPEESQGEHEPQATQDVLYLLSQLLLLYIEQVCFQFACERESHNAFASLVFSENP